MTKKQESYAEKLKRFEKLVSWFESSDVDLGEAVDKFDEASKLAKELKEHLQTVENKVNTIKKNFDK